MHSSPENYTRLYLCALSSLVKEYAKWKASSQPSIPKKSPLNFSSPQPCEASKTHKPKKEVLLPPKIIITPHKKENPSQQDFSTHPNQPLWEDVPSSWQNNGAEPGKYLSPESCRTWRNKGRSAPLTSINIQLLQYSINNPVSTSRKMDAIINLRRRSSPPYIELNNSIHKRETPTTHGDNSVCQVKTTLTKWKEVLQPPCVKCLPVTNVANTLDPHEGQQEQPKKSNYTLIHKPKVLTKSQGKYEASQASNKNDTCQDTLLTIKNKTSPAVWSFDQPGTHDGKVFQNLATQETDEDKFIHKGKQSQPPDVNSSIKASTRRSKHTSSNGRRVLKYSSKGEEYPPTQQKLWGIPFLAKQPYTRGTFPP